MNMNKDKCIHPKFISYIEKYRIYEIFQELVKEVIINRPNDHVIFLKSVLRKIMENGWTLHKIMLFVGPELALDVEDLAERISAELGTITISGSEILQDCTDTDLCILEALGESIPNKLKKKFRNSPFDSRGWLIYEYPRSQKEGYALQQAAVLPTCSLVLQGPQNNITRGPAGILITQMENMYKATLKKIIVKPTWDVSSIVSACCEAARQRPRTIVPIINRVLLLGPPGCTRHVHAQALADKFNLVYVDFKYVLRQAGMKDVGKRTQDPNVDYRVVRKILHKKMYSEDCMNKGWIMTHYPFSVKEFKILDSTDTPPNRILYMRTSEENCKQRILEHDLRNIPHFSEYMTKLRLQELEEFYENETTIRKYCGKTLKEVNAEISFEDMQVLMQYLVLAEPTCDLVRGKEAAERPQTSKRAETTFY